MNQQTQEQAPAKPVASIEERAAAFFSDDNAAPPEPEQSTEAPQAAPDGDSGDTTGDAAPTAEEFFEFEANGKKYSIPKELESNFQLQKDYTQKTQAIAEQRKTFETLAEQARILKMRTEFEQGISQELEQLRAFDAVLSQQNQRDWGSMTTDEIVKTKIQLDQWKEQRDAIRQQLQQKYTEFTGKRDEAIKALRQKANDTVSSRIPGWSEAVQKAVREHALTEGYTEPELEQAGLDPRHWVTLWKAKEYDALKAKAKSAVSDVKSVKTTPSNPMPQHVKDKLNFRKALSKTQPNSSERRRLVEDRAAAIFK